MVGLLDPFEIKGLTFLNRLVLPPMQTGLATSDGAVTDELVDYYTKRAKTVGLVIVEHSYVRLDGKSSEKQLGIYDDELIGGLEQLVSSVHATDTPIIIQINHAGNKTSKKTTGFEPIAPSATENARRLRKEELTKLTEAFTSAADRAMKAGFDGVEVHGAHGFLLNQFYSPLTNKRIDQYGGSLENRSRFPLDVVKRVRDKIGGRLLFYRLGIVDLDPAGTQLEDSTTFSMTLKQSTLDIIDVSGGMCGSRPTQLQSTPGFFVPQAQHIKEIVDIPVIGVGGIRDLRYANNLIEREAVDLIAVGRPLMRDPDWASTALKTLKAD
jgi:2,4-dienoyl-CoA reductase-like NADH-dependent reductase (Old Yellow Enzyme family)